jgi:predicted NBD/HSP70 family sugar kinase
MWLTRGMREPSEPSSGSSAGAVDLLLHMLDGKARTKSELASLTGVSRVTISTRVDALLRAELLRYDGTESSSGGRPPAQVIFNPQAGLTLAVDLGATRATVAVTDLSAKVLGIRTFPLEISDGPESVLDTVFDAADALLDGLPSERLIGVGIGLPGTIEHQTGRPVSVPIMPGWEGFPVREYTSERFPVTILVENDANILALGEQVLSWPDVEDLVFVKVATGIGSGIVSGGDLRRGAQGVAGDIGHIWLPASPELGETLASEHTLGATASGRGMALELTSRGIEVSDADGVAALLSRGDPTAAEVARNAGREIGEVLSMVVNTLNPHLIAIGGSIPRSSEHLLAGIREVVYRRSIPRATQDLQIVHSRGGERAGVLGAATLVIGDLFSRERLAHWIEHGSIQKIDHL